MNIAMIFRIFEQSHFQQRKWNAFGSAIYYDPIGTFAPALMKAWRLPSDTPFSAKLEAWGGGLVESALIMAPLLRTAQGIARGGSIAARGARIAETAHAARSGLLDLFEGRIGQLEGLALRESLPSLDLLSQAGWVLDRAGLNRAGRALERHCNRAGSAFPKATGNTTSKNLQGQFHLDDILSDPNGVFIQDLERGGTKINTQDGRGVYFRNDGVFRGFIESQYE